ncbi:PAS domain-containing protein [Dictyobacter formicarum]|uniref:histidine kinase n=1 Tax=Dictyobacter formicarum TaxID=2778368 RepID=A0ABQ3VP64_9CHLR|nr:PAS domain-containing protein [Dictyobacter formicarum]GHO87600.1 hypothetical protein KSZ_56060 [Dictyobacter formicarum]
MMLDGKQIRHLTLPLWKALIKHIAVQKRAEQQLKESRENFRVLAETVPQLVWTAQPDGSVTYSNHRWYDYTGASPEQALGEEWSQFLHPDDYEHTLTIWHHALAVGEPYEIEYRLKEGQTGAYRWFLARGMPMRDAGGHIVKWFGTCTDIHDKKQVEDEIRVLVDAIPQFVWMLRPDGSCEYTNQRWCDYTNMTSEQAQGDGWLHQAIHPDDQQRVLEVWQSAVQAGRPYEAELRLRNGTTGEYRWSLARGVPFKDAQGTILKWFGTNTDIDEQKQAEQRIKASEEDLRVLAETVPQLVWTARPDGALEYWNQRWYAYSGSSPEQALGEEWSQFLHPDDYEHTLTIWHHALAVGEPYEIEYRLKEGQTGAYRWFLARGMPMRDAGGHIVKWFGTCTDIEDQKRAEQQLKESQESLRVLAETVPQLVWTAQPDGQVEYTNQRWRDYTGVTLEQIQSDRWAHLRFIHPEDRDGNRARWQHALDTKDMYEHEERLKNCQTGEYRWFLTRAHPVRNEGGQIVKWFGTCTDIEEQKQAEERIKISEQNWRMLAETVPQLVWTMQPDGRLEYMNQRYRDWMQPDFELSGDDFWRQFVHPADFERTLALRRHSLETGEPYENEYRLKNRRTGTYHWFLTRALPVRNEAGQIIKWFGTCTDIEEQKQAEERIKISEENWRMLAETVPQLVWTTQPDGRVDYVNQRYCDYTQATLEHIRDDGWHQIVHPEDIERTLALRRQTLATGEPYEIEYRLKNRQTGEYHWFLTRGLPVRNEAGQIIKWFGTSTDIEGQKRAEQQLKESRESLRMLAETVPQLVWVRRPDSRHEYVNQRWCDYTGLTLEHVQSDRWEYLQFIHPDDRESNRAHWQHALETGDMFKYEARLRNAQTGEYRWFLVRALPVRDEGGHIVKWFGTSTDIEDQKRAEQQLKESRESLRVLAETVPQLVWVRRPNSRHEYVNQRCCDYLGLTAEHMQSDPWAHLQFIHPDDQEGHRAHWQHALETGDMFEHKVRLRNAQTGEYRWFLARAMPVRDESGQIVKWFGTCTDIDEQKRLEEALRQSQERANALMNSSIIGTFLAEDEQVVDANDTYLHMLGYSREDLCAGSINWARMTPPEYLARTQQARQELVVHQYRAPYEKEYICQDGSRLPVLVGVVALRLDPHQAIGFVLDNSARKELDQRKDDFINMASHELRNPLTALKMHIQLMRRRQQKQSHDEVVTALSTLEGPIKQLERLIGELLDVSKIQAGKLEYRQGQVDLNELLREITDTVQYSYPDHSIVVRAPVRACMIGDRDRLGQVFTNLISNAIKYSPQAETVEVEMDTTEDVVTVRVRDHGLGIPREQCEKIFERFYRVANPRQKGIAGLGMGLYIVARIVKHHKGTITVESEVGKGSTFTVTLPNMRCA